MKSGGEWRDIDVDWLGLERMPILAREGGTVPRTGRRLRTFYEVGKIERVEIYWGAWRCGDREGRMTGVVEGEGGKWVCKGREASYRGENCLRKA